MKRIILPFVLAVLFGHEGLCSQEPGINEIIRKEINLMVYKDTAFRHPVDKEPNWKKINSSMSKKYNRNTDTVLNAVQRSWFRKKADWDKYGKAVVTYHTAYHLVSKISSDIGVLSVNNDLYTLAEKVRDKKTLLKAAELMTAVNAKFVEVRTIKERNRGNNVDAMKTPLYAGGLDTQACLYYVAGETEKGVALAKQALDLAPDSKELQEHYQKMKNGEKLF